MHAFTLRKYVRICRVVRACRDPCGHSAETVGVFMVHRTNGNGLSFQVSTARENQLTRARHDNWSNFENFACR
jgi:hypothetical protein